MNPNVVWFQLITPSDFAFVISLVKNGMPAWNKKKVLFDVEESKKTKAKPLFTSGEGQKRSFGKTTWSKEGLKYFHKVERTWQEAYSDGKEMCALINGWERWVPDDDLKKGKELLSTSWTIKETMNKKARAKREVGEYKDDNGWDDEDGYHSDKYDDVEDLPFELDNTNLKKVTGLKKLIGEEDLEESDNDKKGNEGDDGEVSAGKIRGDKGEYDVVGDEEVVFERRSKQNKG